jgi:CdiI immunity protein
MNSEEMMTATPAMWHFSGAYLHEDWPEESRDEWTALDAFIEDEPELATRLPAEIARILDQYSNEDELRRFVDQLGASFVPRPESGGYRGWLAEIARRTTPSR